MKFQNKVALITGSGTGIGQAIAKRFVENGASVIILGRRKEPLEDTAKILKEIISNVGSGAFVRIFSGVDVADEKGVTEMFDSIKNDGIQVDYIVNNAGVSGPVTCFANAAMNDFTSTVGIHLTGTFWVSVQGLRVMPKGGRIITISTFFTEERPLEQRPYRFRSPYTASQGAKNRLAEAMSWELVDKGIVSIATNPGPVHSDRIYKTVYPKAAAEFMRVGGFEDLTPQEVELANRQILPLLGEDENTIKEGIKKASEEISKSIGKDSSKLAETLERLLKKIQTIAEKIQSNTSQMIADRQFLSQSQVAETVLNLCDEEIGNIVNGKVIPGDRVFYPVKPHVGTNPIQVQPDFAGKTIVFTIDSAGDIDVERVESLGKHIEDNGGKTVCFVSKNASKEKQDAISNLFHSHVIDLNDSAEVERWFSTAKTKIGDISAVVHFTGNVPEMTKMTEISRQQWDKLIERFITNPANIVQRALDQFVPGGAKDPRLFKDAAGTVMIVGPDLPSGKKVAKTARAHVEVFRGALRPFTTTVNQELSDVLKSKVRVFLVLAGSVANIEPKNDRIAQALNFAVSENATKSSEVIFCVDEIR